MSEVKEKSRFGLLEHDGINLFYDDKWTGLEVPGVEEGRAIIEFLETLTEDQLDHWISVQKYIKGSYKTFNVLKHDARYSGQTTCYPHKDAHGKDKWQSTPFAGTECIQAKNIFEVQWTNCPVEVEDEVRKLWDNESFGNDFYYYSWDNEEEQREEYPVIAGYLDSHGITKCLIHWWW